MQEEQALIAKAIKAAEDYRTVYGKYPEKLGFHPKQLAQMKRDCLIFPELTQLTASFVEEPPDLSQISYQQTRIPFVSITSGDASWNNVYVPAPHNEHGAWSSEGIARMAREWET